MRGINMITIKCQNCGAQYAVANIMFTTVTSSTQLRQHNPWIANLLAESTNEHQTCSDGQRAVDVLGQPFLVIYVPELAAAKCIHKGHKLIQKRKE